MTVSPPQGDVDLPLFLRAARGQSVPRLPVWIMRQAGRYLPEYRAVRERVDFLTLCRTPELACEVTLQPLRRFPLDAAIVFSDIMMPLEAMGVELTFHPGPKITHPIAQEHDVARLHVPAAGEAAPYVAQTIALLRRELKVPLIGFAGAPLTLAAYLVQGKGDKDFAKLRAFCYAQPLAATALLDKLTAMTLVYLQDQVRAGAQAIQIFESWAGIFGTKMYEQLVLPRLALLFEQLAPLGVPRILFAQHATGLLPLLAQLDCDVVGLDFRTDLLGARHGLGPKKVLQGNLDPAVLFAEISTVKQHTQQVAQRLKGQGHIFNLGHGILPETPIAHVHAMLDVLHHPTPMVS